MTEDIDIMFELLKNGECLKAKNFITEKYGRCSIKEYAEAYISVLIIETVKKMNREIPVFYEDQKQLQIMLFDDSPYNSIEKVIRRICDSVKNSRAANNEAMLNKAVEYIEEFYCDTQISAGRVADITGLSQPQLTELFKRKFKMGVAEYITSIRIKSSVGPLLNGKCRISDIAARFGFITSEAYIRAFKRVYRATPGRFREMMQREI